MRIRLDNQFFHAEIESFGAELKSLVKKENGQEYLWEADPAYWGKTSPILFPSIGKLADGGYRYGGAFYAMEKHGFARDMDYKVAHQEDGRVVLTIESNEDTLRKFPFPFLLEVEYVLSDKGVEEKWRLHNQGESTMYFSFGGHPAFACPLVIDGVKKGKRTDCAVKIYGPKEEDILSSTEINIETGLLTGKHIDVPTKQGVFPIVDHIFDRDALVLEGQNITAVGLLDGDGVEYVRLEAPGCPVWGIWSMPTSDASYVCIEPWWGICDQVGYQGTIEERHYINQARAGEVWEAGFLICC